MLSFKIQLTYFVFVYTPWRFAAIAYILFEFSVTSERDILTVLSAIHAVRLHTCADVDGKPV